MPTSPRAYPRGRGGAGLPLRGPDRLRGLSPRTRGSQPWAPADRVPLGPIPADAGEPSCSACRPTRRGAYPRGRGGAGLWYVSSADKTGLSPRTRGSPMACFAPPATTGPIPADAGEPRPIGPMWHIQTAYPRGRGGAGVWYDPSDLSTGLSPRTRGSRNTYHGPGVCFGPIPADAGEPYVPSAGRGREWAYPRGRGGADVLAGGTPCQAGLSPRTRGSPSGSRVSGGCRGPIPADAGEPERSSRDRLCQWAYPRGRGGAAFESAGRWVQEGLSPRTRGSPLDEAGGIWRPGPIPADAGEPGRSTPTNTPTGAYPRGRGGARPVPTVLVTVVGLSPRTRGSHAVGDLARGLSGPIPADAGEPSPGRAARGTLRAYPRGRGGA